MNATDYDDRGLLELIRTAERNNPTAFGLVKDSLVRAATDAAEGRPWEPRLMADLANVENALTARLAALKARAPEQLAEGSTSPIAGEDVPTVHPVAGAPLPPEVEAALGQYDDDPELVEELREFIARHRALPATVPLPPLTDRDVLSLCVRFPSSAADIYASRRFAEAVRHVTALYDDGDPDLTEAFATWMGNGEDTVAEPKAPSSAEPADDFRAPSLDPELTEGEDATVAREAEIDRKLMCEYSEILRAARAKMDARRRELLAELGDDVAK